MYLGIVVSYCFSATRSSTTGSDDTVTPQGKRFTVQEIFNWVPTIEGFFNVNVI